MAILNTSLTTILGNIYVSSGASVVSVMYFCNTDSSARTFNLYAVPANVDLGNVDVSQQIYKDVQVSPGDTFVIDMEKLVLADSEYLVANTSANTSIIATTSYTGI